MRRTAFAAFFLLLFLASCAVEGPRALGPSPSASAVALPRPIPQPITRTSPAAQVAWLWTFSPDRKHSLVGIDPSGARCGVRERVRITAHEARRPLRRHADADEAVHAALDEVTRGLADRGIREAHARSDDVAFSERGLERGAP